MMNLEVLFNFFLISSFLDVSEVKGQKIAQNEK